MTAQPWTVLRPEGPSEHRPIRALFLGSAYAGHATRFASLQHHLERDQRLVATCRRITGWNHDGRLESLALVPRGVRGRLRATLEAAPFSSLRRPDVIWTSASEVLTPYLWSQEGPLRRPLILDLDATRDQLEAMAPHYKQRPSRTGFSMAVARKRDQMLWRTVSLFTPWSSWAADGLRDAGVSGDRIGVIPPGVDLDYWRCPPRSAPIGRPVRILFVGGDFVRKGGDLLLKVMKSPLGQEFELDIVTRDRVEAHGNVRIHRFEQGDPQLRELYTHADLFVMPTRAECFGIATVEAMAAGLPVLVSDVGGVRDIVVHGRTGWLLGSAGVGLERGLQRALTERHGLGVLGTAGRHRAERLFDAERNNAATVDALLSLACRPPLTT